MANLKTGSRSQTITLHYFQPVPLAGTTCNINWGCSTATQKPTSRLRAALEIVLFFHSAHTSGGSQWSALQMPFARYHLQHYCAAEQKKKKVAGKTFHIAQSPCCLWPCRTGLSLSIRAAHARCFAGARLLKSGVPNVQGHHWVSSNETCENAHCGIKSACWRSGATELDEYAVCANDLALGRSLKHCTKPQMTARHASKAEHSVA